MCPSSAGLPINSPPTNVGGSESREHCNQSCLVDLQDEVACSRRLVAAVVCGGVWSDEAIIVKEELLSIQGFKVRF